MTLDGATTALLGQMTEGPTPHEVMPEEARGLGPSQCDSLGSGPEVARIHSGTFRTSGGGSFGLRILVPSDVF
jgi:acetyl esterase